MTEPTNPSFHDQIRRTLDDYRPAHDPQDWQQLRRAIRRRRWRLVLGLGSFGLLLLVGIGWVSGIFSHEPSVRIVAKKTRYSGNPATSAPITQTRTTKPVLAIVPAAKKQENVIDIPLMGQPHQQSIHSGFTAIDKANQPDQLQPIVHRNTLIIRSIFQEKQLRLPHIPELSPEEADISRQMLTGEVGPDSTTWQALSRNLRQWPDAVIVCDLTSSMYPYSTQLFAWFRQHARQPGISGIVFFTDCDSLGQQTRPGGPPGQMFVTRDRNVLRVLPLMLTAARNTVHNEDDAENDVEALLFAQQTFPKARHLILLADNMSQVKDISRLDGLRKPVHVVLCGTTGGYGTQPFQSDYMTIASRNGGSLHTLEDDIAPGSIEPGTTLHVGSRYYRYAVRKKQFVLTPFTHRPVRLFGFLWL